MTSATEWFESFGTVRQAIPAVIIFLFSAHECGYWTLCRYLFKSVRTRIICSVIIGVNLLGFLVFILSVSSVFLFFRPSFFLYAFALIAILIRLFYFRHRKIFPGFNVEYSLILLGLIALVMVGPSLCLPVNWDEQVYHITVPFRWLQIGTPVVFSDLPYSAFPGLNMFINLVLIDMGGVIAPRLFVWACWGLVLLSIYDLASRKAGPWTSLCMALIFGLSSTAILVLQEGYTEFLLVGDMAGILMVFLQVMRNVDKRHSPIILQACACGIMAGGASSIKLTGISVIPVVFLGFYVVHNVCIKNIIKPIFVYIATVALFAIPFFLRPWFLTGNPFFPYFASWFNSSHAVVEMSRFHYAITDAHFGSKSLAMFFTAPIWLCLRDRLFAGSFGIPFLFVLLSFVIVIRYLRDVPLRERVFFGGAALIQYGFWFFSSQQARFFLTGALVILIGGIPAIIRLCPRFRQLFLTGAMLCVVFMLPRNRIAYLAASWMRIIGRMPVVDYVSIGTGDNYVPAVMALAEDTPTYAKVLLLWEHRTLYMPRETVIGTPFFQAATFTPPDSLTPEDVLAELKKAKFSHLLMVFGSNSPDELPNYARRSVPLVRSILQLAEQGKFKRIWQSSRFVLYDVSQGSVDRPRPKRGWWNDHGAGNRPERWPGRRILDRASLQSLAPG